MKTQTWITEYDLTRNDLSLTLDRTGRLWKFRPTTAPHGTQPVDAHLTDEGIVLTVQVDGLESGDVDLCADGEVLQIRGRADRTMHLACDVAMPRPVALSAIETEYTNGVLFITVAPATEADLADAVPECMPVAV
jgi:HSP20 family molecular chaperone IbpA